MPSDEVMHKWRTGRLRSGNRKTGKKVRGRKQAIAIMLSERRAEKAGRGHKRRTGRSSSR